MDINGYTVMDVNQWEISGSQDGATLVPYVWPYFEGIFPYMNDINVVVDLNIFDPIKLLHTLFLLIIDSYYQLTKLLLFTYSWYYICIYI